MELHFTQTNICTSMSMLLKENFKRSKLGLTIASPLLSGPLLSSTIVKVWNLPSSRCHLPTLLPSCGLGVLPPLLPSSSLFLCFFPPLLPLLPPPYIPSSNISSSSSSNLQCVHVYHLSIYQYQLTCLARDRYGALVRDWVLACYYLCMLYKSWQTSLKTNLSSSVLHFDIVTHNN